MQKEANENFNKPVQEYTRKDLLIDNSAKHRAVNVADCPMGVGKTSAAISLINSSGASEKFIFATPYLSECNRIEYGCTSKCLVAIDNDKSRSKSLDLHNQVILGNSVSCTHQLLLRFDEDTRKMISDQNYTLIIDEAIDVTRDVSGKELSQIHLLINHGCLTVDETTGVVSLVDDNEKDMIRQAFGGAEIFSLIDHGYVTMTGDKIFIWSFPIEVLDCFKRILILTYQFNSQLINYYLQLNSYAINHIGVRKNDSSEFEFCCTDESDGFRYDVKSLIHILDNKKLNRIGEEKCALSSNWFKKNSKNDEEKVYQLGRNIRNVQKNIFKCKTRDFIWTVYDGFRNYVEDRNIRNRYVSCNLRAENKWKDCHYLAYGIGMYQNPQCANYFKSKGYPVDGDKWALQTMLQWIWRSAIRNGEEIYIYIPSKKMRTLLIEWIDSISGGGVAGV